MKNKLICVIFSLVIILTLAKIFLSASLATTGVQLVEIENEIRFIKNETSLIEERIIQGSSLQFISQEAGRLNLSQKANIVSLSQEIPLALDRNN